MKISILIAIVISFTSCLTSLHPLVTADKVVSEDRVVGNWVHDDVTIHIERFLQSEVYKNLTKMSGGLNNFNNGNAALQKQDSILYAHGYSVSYRKDGVDYFMFGAVTKIGNNFYFDLLPVIADDPKNQEGTGFEYTNDYLPAFTMAKLEINKNALNLHFLDGDFIKAQIKSGNMRIKHEKDAMFETFVVTASSVELRQFIEKYGHDERLFDKENSVTLTRKG